MKNGTFLIRDKCCHLVICLYLIKPHFFTSALVIDFSNDKFRFQRRCRGGEVMGSNLSVSFFFFCLLSVCHLTSLIFFGKKRIYSSTAQITTSVMRADKVKLGAVINSVLVPSRILFWW